MGGCGSKGAQTRSPGSSGIKMTNERSDESASGGKVKIILVGAGGVGKTSILLQFSDGLFSADRPPTIGVDFKSQDIKVGTPPFAKTVKLELWDTAGQERFRSVISSFFRDADGVLLVFDLTEPQSLSSLDSWLVEVRKHASSTVEVLMVGNKSDLVEKRKVSDEEAQAAAEEFGIKMLTCSALDRPSVIRCLGTLATDILDSKRKRRT